MPPSLSKLEALLSDLFSADQLRRFLLAQPWGEAVVDELPGAGTPKAELVHQAARGLKRGGRIDRALFASLRRKFPGRKADIDAVAAQWGFASADTAAGDTSQPERGPASAPPAPPGSGAPALSAQSLSGVHIHGGTYHNLQILQGDHGRQNQRNEAIIEYASSWPSPASAPTPPPASPAGQPEFSSRRSRGEMARPGAKNAAPGRSRAGGGPLPTWNPVRLLHLSDLHFSARRAWDQDPVLAGLVEDVARLRAATGDLHRVLVTGDIADRGKAEELDKAADWLTGPLARAAGVQADAIRVVAGNHDVDRSAIDRAVKNLDADIISDGDEVISEILLNPNLKAPILRRQSNFLTFAARFHPGLTLPWWSSVEAIAGWRVRLVGLNTAWLAGSHKDGSGQVDDHRQLALGGPQWNALFPASDDADLCLAMMHHPWEDLAPWDRAERQEATFQRCGVVLRGHLHEAEALSVKSASFQVLTLAAGACYADPVPGWPHGYQLLELDPGRGEARVHLRKWHTKSRRWIADQERYPGATPQGVASLPLRRSPLLPPIEPDPEDRDDEPTDPGGHAAALAAAREKVRAAVRRRVEDMPWLSRQLGLSRTLSEVCVRVEIRVMDLAHEQKLERAEDHRRLLDVIGPASARWVLLGEPGSGKSTLLRRLALDLAAGEDWLPVLLHAGDLRKHGLTDAIRAVWGEQAADVVAGWPRRRLAVLVDGLDETGHPRETGRALQAIAEDLGEVTLIIAGRYEAYPDPWPGFGALQLLPLAAPEQAALLKGLGVPRPLAERSLTRLRADRRLAEIAGRPLLLTLAALVLLKDGELPDRRVKLYERSLDCLLHRAELNPDAPHDVVRAPSDVEEALVWLAPRLLQRGEGPWSRASVLGYLRGNEALMRSLRETWPENTADAFLDETGRTVGVLVPQGRGFGFAHRTLGEYLASRALVKDPGARELAVAAGLADPARWAEILALTVGQLTSTEADALVRRVLQQGEAGRALLHQVVAEAEGLSPDTVLAVLGLERGWKKWQDRQKILQDLPALAGDRGLAVRLLDRYRRETTDGNDLFWIRATLTAIAEDPKADLESRREAEEARDRLFEHMQERRAEAVGLLKELWKPIPAGSFRMGSPDGEGDSDEHPQHKVTFKTGFQMMSVPVTWRLYALFDPGHAAARFRFNGLPADQHAEAPVYYVTWFASTMFAAWVGARLPLEAEWEYACRSKTTTPYWSGKTEADLDRVGWTKRNSGSHPHKVAELPANPWGLHDMHGNVWEWCLDLWDSGAYAARRGGVTVDPAVIVGLGGASSADAADHGRVRRGGAWVNTPFNARSAYRNRSGPTSTWSVVGFRLVRPVVVSEPGG